MNFDILRAELADPHLILPLLFSLLTGALIGGEREFNRKPAGLRTHTLLCFASALMTLVGLRMDEWIAVLPEGTQVVSDMSRMPHAILTGIGFLGAGVIFKGGFSVQGLTTAATLWLTGALGVVYGTGMVELGLLGTATALVVLVLLRFVQKLAPHPEYAEIEVTYSEGSEDLAGLRQRLAAEGLQTDVKSARTAEGQTSYVLIARGAAQDLAADRILGLLAKSPGTIASRFEAALE